MELTATNLSIRDIGEELRMSKPQVQRLQAKGNARRELLEVNNEVSQVSQTQQSGFWDSCCIARLEHFFVQNIITSIA